jgi:excisionase family DNA binding protein
MNATATTQINRHWTDRDTLTVKEAGTILGLGRTLAYEAVKRGEIPTIRVGGRILVPVVPLRLLLGHGIGSE